MGRAERELDPLAGPVQRFAWELRELRRAAGAPGYRELATRVHFSASTLAEAAGGRTAPSLAVTLAYVRGCGGDVAQWERRWHALRAELAPLGPGGPLSPGGTGPGPEQPPYLGLNTFGPQDAARFLGRARLTAELVERVRSEPVTCVVGASGSGKSSLLRAGLLPAVAGHGIVLTPGPRPRERLAAALAELPEGRAVLVVDQFEEVFTLCPDAAAREEFLTRLLGLPRTAGSRGPGELRVALGLRADFYAACARHPALLEVLRTAQFLVGPMTEAELREAVTGPAEQAGYRVDPALVDAVVADAVGRSGVLPLLSHALLETWHRRQGRALTLAGYRSAGGLTEAIARTAERVHGELTPQGRQLSRDLFIRLTALGEGTEDTRRRLPHAELPDHEALPGLLERLVAARLVTVGADDVSVTHEALIQRWPRLREWLATDRDRLRDERRLTEAATEWQAHGRDEAYLYRGVRLAAWDERPAERLNAVERAFLDAGRRREHAELAARRRRGNRTLGLLVSAVVLVSLLAALSAVQARRAGDERDLARAGELAVAAREQLPLRPELSLELARRSLRLRRTALGEAALRQAASDDHLQASLTTGLGEVFGVAVRPDGGQLAVSGDGGRVRLWQLGAEGAVRPGFRELTGHTGEVWSPVYSADGRRLAACGGDHTVTVWDLAAGGPPRVLRGHTAKVWRASFSRDGRLLATTGDDGAVRLWDPASGAALRVLTPVTGRQIGVDFSPDGRRLAAGDAAGTIRIWDVAGGPSPVREFHQPGAVENLDFGDRVLVSAGTDGAARVWDPRSAAAPVVLRGDGSGTIEAVALSPDGQRVAAAGSEGTVRVFSVTGQDDPLVLPGHEGTVWTLAFAPGGRRLLSGCGDGTLRFWDPGDPGARVLHFAEGGLWPLAADRTGRLLVAGSETGPILVRRDGGPGAVTTTVLRGHRDCVTAVALSADARQLASAGLDGTVRVWDLATGGSRVLRTGAAQFWGVAFLPGDRLATADTAGLVRIWDLASGTSTRVLRGHQGGVSSLAVSPDGHRLASTGRDGTVRIWDVATGGSRVLRGHRGGLVRQVAFSPDGTRVASAGDDGTVRIWALGGGTEPLVLRGHRGAVWSVGYSADGTLLASAGADGGLRLWRADRGELSVAVRGFGSPVNATRFGPGAEWIATSHEDGTLRLSRCDACAPQSRIEAAAAGRGPVRYRAQ